MASKVESFVTLRQKIEIARPKKFSFIDGDNKSNMIAWVGDEGELRLCSSAIPMVSVGELIKWLKANYE